MALYRSCGCLSDSYKTCVHQRLKCKNGCEYPKESCSECPFYQEETELTSEY